jgi:hypothetical protein
MLLSNDTDAIPGNDRVGFYNMENALHLAFQPFSMLTMVYTRDGFDQGSKSQDAFGMISGGPWASYLKMGRFRTPFGLRIDDHTVATRNGYLDFLSVFPQLRYLPYDPRNPDMGIEVGAENSGFFGRASYTNGESHPLFSTTTRAQAKTAKLGYVSPKVQGAVSFYDDFRDGTNVLLGPFRASRWSVYGMVAQVRFRPLSRSGRAPISSRAISTTTSTRASPSSTGLRRAGSTSGHGTTA